MTYKEKYEALVAEIERQEEETSIGLNEHENGIEHGRMEVIHALREKIESMQEDPASEEANSFKSALKKKVREAQDWTYIEEEGGECPLNEEFGAYDLKEFAEWGAQWQREHIIKKIANHEQLNKMVDKFEAKYKPEKVLDTEYYKRGIFDTLKVIKEG